MLRCIVANVLVCLLTGGCGGDFGQTSLQFVAKTAVQAAGTKPSFDELKIKVVYARIFDDVAPGTTTPNNLIASVYHNPECKARAFNECGIPGEPATYIIQSFFDFSSLSAANASLASSGAPNTVAPGTYRYLKLDFSRSGTIPSDNINYTIHGSTPKTGRMRANPLFRIDPPLTVDKSGSSKISLSYDPQDFLIPSTTDFGNGLCDNNPDVVPPPSSLLAGATYWCLGDVAISPSASN